MQFLSQTSHIPGVQWPVATKLHSAATVHVPIVLADILQRQQAKFKSELLMDAGVVLRSF